MRRNLLLILTLAACLAAPSPALAAKLMGAGLTGSYQAGPNIIEGAVPPPPGDYLNLSYVYSRFGRVNDKDGEKDPTSPTFNGQIVTPRYMHFFEEPVLGAQVGFDIALQMAHLDVSSDLFVDQSVNQLGDTNVEAIAGWMFTNNAVMLRLGGYVPTGEYQKEKPINFGKDFWSGYVQLRDTFWFDDAHDWSVSAQATYESHSNMRSYRVHPGDDLTLEYGLSRKINDTWSLALAGYSVYQMTADRGTDVGWDTEDKDEVHALGPAARVFLPFKPGQLLNIHYWHEYGAKNRSQGDTFFIELSTPF